MSRREHAPVIPGILPPSAAMLRLAREFRANPTPAEAAFWEMVRRKQLGVRFRRQMVIGPTIVDFYAHLVRLVIEVDGGVHLGREQRDRDAGRDLWLGRYGLRVVRLTNEMVLESPEETKVWVSEAIGIASARLC